MSLTFEQANDEILAVFQAVWQPLGHVAVYENVKGSKPGGASDVWARVTVRHSTASQVSLANRSGVRRYQRLGVLGIQVFVPLGEGLSEAYTLSKTVADAFEGTATPGAVWFSNVRLNEIGPSGEWFQFNVLADFEYDEIK